MAKKKRGFGRIFGAITGSPYERLLKQVDKVVDEAGSDRALAKTLRKLVKTVGQQYEEGNIDEEEHDLVIEAIEEVDPEGRSFSRLTDDSDSFYDDGDMPDSPELKLGKRKNLDDLMKSQGNEFTGSFGRDEFEEFRQKMSADFYADSDDAIAAGDHQHEIRTQNRVFADAEEGITQLKKKMAEEKKILSEEWVANNAAQYFFNEGLNEEGVEIFIEELGLENFVEFVHDLVEDSELIEAYALTSKKKVTKKLPKGTQPAKTTKATIARGDRKIKSASPSGAFKKRPVAAKAVETAKKQQPKKRSALDGIARTVLKGMDRHKKAMAKAKSDIETTKKIASKVGKGAREFGKGIASGVRTAGKTVKVAKKAVSEQSNWRTDLSEVMTDEMNDKPIKEKNVKNKIKINPTMGEAVEELGGTLIEEIEVDEFDYIVESVYDELIEEGFSEDDVEEAIEHSLNEVSDRYYDSAVKSSKSAAAKIKRKELKKKAVGRLKFMKRKAGEAVKSAKTKFAQAQVAGYNKGREALQKASDARRKAKQSVSNTSGRAKKGLKGFIKKQAQKVVDRMSEELVDEKFSMAADDSKPQSPRPTKLPKSRERNIGKHDDWKDNPNRDFGERPEKGKKLKSRASAVVQSQRRTDKEVGVREELSIDDQMRISKEYNRKSPEEKKAANMKVLGNIKKIAAKKDTRTDAQKMTDATGPRPGSRYRGD